jgi:nitroreductase
MDRARRSLVNPKGEEGYTLPTPKNLFARAQGVSAAIQNMLLMAHSMGLGSLWINDVYYAVRELEEYFDNSWELIAGTSFGYPHESEVNKNPTHGYL